MYIIHLLGEKLPHNQSKVDHWYVPYAGMHAGLECLLYMCAWCRFQCAVSASATSAYATCVPYLLFSAWAFWQDSNKNFLLVFNFFFFSPASLLWWRLWWQYLLTNGLLMPACPLIPINISIFLIIYRVSSRVTALETYCTWCHPCTFHVQLECSSNLILAWLKRRLLLCLTLLLAIILADLALLTMLDLYADQGHDRREAFKETQGLVLHHIYRWHEQ